MQGNKIHLEHALAGGYFISDYQSAAVNIWDEVKDLIF